MDETIKQTKTPHGTVSTIKLCPEGFYYTCLVRGFWSCDMQFVRSLEQALEYHQKLVDKYLNTPVLKEEENEYDLSH